MNSLTDLREVVDVVIGVDTHVHTHSAAVVDAATGGVLDEITVDATAQGYAEMVEFANNHPVLRAWAIEGTGGHGAGLSRHLMELSEIVIELDRPKRAARRNGAKSDPLDAIRAAREAMARPRLGTPRAGGERQALSVLLAARRSAVNASTEAQQQVFSLVIAAPEPIRVRFRGQKLAGMLSTPTRWTTSTPTPPSTTLLCWTTSSATPGWWRSVRAPTSLRMSGPPAAGSSGTCTSVSASTRSRCSSGCTRRRWCDRGCTTETTPGGWAKWSPEPPHGVPSRSSAGCEIVGVRTSSVSTFPAPAAPGRRRTTWSTTTSHAPMRPPPIVPKNSRGGLRRCRARARPAARGWLGRARHR